MYPNDLSRDLVNLHRDEMLAAADAHRRSRLVAQGDGWSVVIVRRAVGSHLVRLGNAVTGNDVTGDTASGCVPPVAEALTEPA